MSNENEERNSQNNNLSDQELRNRLDLYQRLSKDVDNALLIEKIKIEYQKNVKKQEEQRGKQAVHYSQGVKSGLPQVPYQQLQYYHEKEDERLRGQMVKESKEVYAKDGSLSKEFSNSHKDKEKQ